jgi:hypothetical protein
MKFKGGRRNAAAAWGDGMLIGARPGGRVGVLRASDGIGGGGPCGGGVCARPAYGLVTYDVSDVIDGIGSRSPELPARRLFSPTSLPPRGDLPGDRRVRSPVF